ncbi:alpha-amylase family glycosyl hydrolase [Pontibacter beigongshangensis]|uniref:alpha-amylase family glycosyl hydrolase n=1 Tax=Pontibacter beigongshangensis TaxID=2574733 RepID=UPI0016506E79|nr:alpha-amylase family glycosyl hydrolase [Pontibacter beigongshangensis]
MQSEKPGSKTVSGDLWWQKGIIYEVYIRSFNDSNGDGIGDLKGLTEKLDYLHDLGIDCVWVTPFYQSPMKDFGYDISDFKSVDKMFGTMKDFDELLHETHKRGMKLILDQVPNHTSDQHEWFKEARSSRDNPKRDWFIWADADAEGNPPNNWLAMFGGSAWEWDEKTEQFYYHAFLKEQPDLNWRNPEVQEAVLEEMRFWLDKGVDGFRVDVMWHLIKDEYFRDNPDNPDYKEEQPTYNQLQPVYSTDQPEVHDIIEKMRDLTDSYPERVLIGEIYLPIHQLVSYYGPDNQGAQLPFNFQLLTLPWEPKKIAIAIDQYEGALPNSGWPNWVIGNHDQSRLATKVGEAQARVAAMLLLTLRGTPTLYYGDEIGMQDVKIPKNEMQDPQGLHMPDKDLSRDPFRSPMPWNDSANAGFTTGKPWLRMAKNIDKLNVQAQQEDPDSLLALYKKLIALRRQEPALHKGRYRPVYSDDKLIAYLRETDEKRFLIVLNLSDKGRQFAPERFKFKGKVILSLLPDHENETVENEIRMKGDEGLIIELE